MIRREKVAERVASQRLKDMASEEEEEKRLEASGLKKAEPDRGEMVFGNSAKGEVFQFYDDDSTSSEGEDDDSSMAETTGGMTGLSVAGSVAGSMAGGETAISREHKRLKRWGKKNKKLRSKTPYADDTVGGTTNFAVYSTNRSVRAGDGGPVERNANGGDKVKRQDPRNTYGVDFSRNTFNYQKKDLTTEKLVISPSLPPTEIQVESVRIKE
jgi:hypothetical protein